MKYFPKYIGSLLLTITFFLVFGNIALAKEKIVHFGVIEASDNVETSKNDKPLLIDEISLGESSQTISQNEYIGFGFGGVFYPNQIFSPSSLISSNTSSYHLKDKRKTIFNYLFPFHFFW